MGCGGTRRGEVSDCLARFVPDAHNLFRQFAKPHRSARSCGAGGRAQAAVAKSTNMAKNAFGTDATQYLLSTCELMQVRMFDRVARIEFSIAADGVIK